MLAPVLIKVSLKLETRDLIHVDYSRQHLELPQPLLLCKKNTLY